MKKVAGLYELEALARNHKSVICPWSRAFDKPKPAAFIINLSGATIFDMIKRGLFVYQKNSKLKKETI